MAVRHTQAWHRMHDEALAARAAEKAGTPPLADVHAAPDMSQCGTAMPLLDRVTVESPRQGRHDDRAEHRAHGRQTGDFTRD